MRKAITVFVRSEQAKGERWCCWKNCGTTSSPALTPTRASASSARSPPKKAWRSWRLARAAARPSSTSGRRPCRRPRPLRRPRRHRRPRRLRRTCGGACSTPGATWPPGPSVLRCLTSPPTLTPPPFMIGFTVGRLGATTVEEFC